VEPSHLQGLPDRRPCRDAFQAICSLPLRQGGCGACAAATRKVDAIERDGASREQFLARAILAGGALTAGGLLVAGLPRLASSAASPAQDKKILNFALLLEYIEAGFYSDATCWSTQRRFVITSELTSLSSRARSARMPARSPSWTSATRPPMRGGSPRLRSTSRRPRSRPTTARLQTSRSRRSRRPRRSSPSRLAMPPGSGRWPGRTQRPPQPTSPRRPPKCRPSSTEPAGSGRPRWTRCRT